MPEYHKIKEVETIEGWAFGCPSIKFNDIVVDAFVMLFEVCKKEAVFTSVPMNRFYDSILGGSELTVSMDVVTRLVPPLLLFLSGGNAEKKLLWTLVDLMGITLHEK